jgi:hypothetical protein
MRHCQHPDCERRHHAGGYCTTHYRRHRAGIPLDAPRYPNRPTNRTCTIPGCLEKHYALDLCRRHYRAEWDGRDPLQLPPRNTQADGRTQHHT